MSRGEFMAHHKVYTLDEVFSALSTPKLVAADRKAGVRRAVELALLGNDALNIQCGGEQGCANSKDDYSKVFDRTFAGIARIAGASNTQGGASPNMDFVSC